MVNSKEVNFGIASLMVILTIPVIIIVAVGSVLVLNGTIKLNSDDINTSDNSERKFDKESVKEMIQHINPTVEPTNAPQNIQPTKAPNTQLETTPQAQNTSSFQSYGAISIEGGATAHVTSATKTDNTMKAHVIYTNPTSGAITVNPVRTSLRSNALGYGPEPGIIDLTLQPGTSREFDLSYTLQDDPPYRWVFANLDGSEAELAKYE